MVYVLVGIHILVCVFLIIVVLLQSGKAADLAGAFGGMGSQTAFGPRGAATVLSKATTVAAVLFMTTSLVLSVIATRQGGGSGTGSSVLDREKTKAPPKAPAPGTPQPKVPVSVPGGPAGGAVNIQVVPPGQQPAPGGGIAVTPSKTLPSDAVPAEPAKGQKGQTPPAGEKK
jgi:preprotein translocase subunit SecG